MHPSYTGAVSGDYGGAYLLDYGGAWLLPFRQNLSQAKGKVGTVICRDLSFYPLCSPLSLMLDSWGSPPLGPLAMTFPPPIRTEHLGKKKENPKQAPNLCPLLAYLQSQPALRKSDYASSLLRKIQWLPEADGVFLEQTMPSNSVCRMCSRECFCGD